MTAEQKEKEHIDQKARLNARIQALEKTLLESKKTNTEDELKLTAAFQ
jgi:hypothetical protein